MNAHRIEQIAATAMPVACTDVGIWRAFLPDTISTGVVITSADLAWLLATASNATQQQAELDRLRAWKQEATPIFDGLQDLGSALDLPLGVLVTGPIAVESAANLRAERDHLAQAVANFGEWAAKNEIAEPPLDWAWFGEIVRWADTPGGAT